MLTPCDEADESRTFEGRGVAVSADGHAKATATTWRLPPLMVRIGSANRAAAAVMKPPMSRHRVD